VFNGGTHDGIDILLALRTPILAAAVGPATHAENGESEGALTARAAGERIVNSELRILNHEQVAQVGRVGGLATGKNYLIRFDLL
jgi:hypothetical protein